MFSYLAYDFQVHEYNMQFYASHYSTVSQNTQLKSLNLNDNRNEMNLL